MIRRALLISTAVALLVCTVPEEANAYRSYTYSYTYGTGGWSGTQTWVSGSVWTTGADMGVLSVPGISDVLVNLNGYGAGLNYGATLDLSPMSNGLPGLDCFGGTTWTFNHGSSNGDWNCDGYVFTPPYCGSVWWRWHCYCPSYCPKPPKCPPIPAPGALLLAGLGAACVGWLRRRRAV